MKSGGFGPLVVLAAGLIAAACSSSDDEEQNVAVCHKQEEPSDKEKVYTAGNYRVITDPKVDARAAKFFLAQIPQVQKNVANLFGLPAENSATVWLVDDKSPHHDLCKDAPGCWEQGSVYLFFNEDTFAKLNQQAAEEKIFRDDRLIHEFSHALPLKLIPSLEEGMARYAELSLASSQAKELPTEAATLSYEQEIQVGESLTVADGLPSPLLSLQILSYNTAQESFVVQYQRSDGANSKKVALLNGQAFVEKRLLVQFLAENGRLIMKIYDHPKNSRWIGPVEHLCHENGWENVGEEKVLTENDEYVDVVQTPRVYPFVQAEKIDGESLPYEVYETNFCFFELLREKYGDDVVKNLVRAVYEFYQAHPDESVPFDLLGEVMKITGMSEAEAREYFARFYVPTDSEDHQYGGMCW